MKVYIGPYKNWFGPYQLAKALCFWAKPVKDEYGFYSDPDWVHRFGEWLAHGSINPEPAVGDIITIGADRPSTWLYKFLLWLDSKNERKIKVRIDGYDTWSMDDTLAHIILPMLKQLKAKNNSSPYVDDEDVPEHLRKTSAPELTQEEKAIGEIDANHTLRWDWVIDEMIFAFECSLDHSIEDKFFTPNETKMQFKVLENGMRELLTSSTSSYAFEARKAHEARVQKGFELFGKYYQNLWS
jgi:hypothetical protein